MKSMTRIAFAASVAVAVVTTAAGLRAQQNAMTFFISSTGSGNGGNLGGLEGADALCTRLAKAAGATSTNWRAYLSTTGAKLVNARDRIGKGPWQNAKGVVVARSVDDLHSANNNLNKQTALTETGAVVNGRGDKPNTHDMLTGSTTEGRAVAGDGDSTCGNWTSSGEGSTLVGHHDRQGVPDTEENKSWNSTHRTTGCSQQGLVSTGGAGLIYCFAAN